jgi:hypothetical protein
MRRIILSFAALVAVTVAQAASFFTLADGDSVRINPNKLDGYQPLVFTASMEGYTDSWSLEMTYPEGLIPKLVAGITPLEGMTVTYTNRYGETATQTADLHVSAEYRSISSYLTGEGYWDYNQDGILETYGSVKWEPGTTRMFSMNFYVNPAFRQGNIIIDGHFASASDRRGPILADVYFFRRCHLWVGYERGDVSGDDRINVADVVMLIDHVLGADTLDEFQARAADVNADDTANICDVSDLIDIILHQ